LERISLLALDAEYYINRVFIPSLSRIFNIIGVDVAAWYLAMPRMIRVSKSGGLLDTTNKPNPSSKIPEKRPAEAVDNLLIDLAQPSSKPNKLLVDEHFRSDRCLNCEKEGQKGV
jgi:DNA polymerase zeta